MTEQQLAQIRELLTQCSSDERQFVFQELRGDIRIHRLEEAFDAPAEVILEAIYRAPELTRRMLRGVIADAAFAQFVVTALAEHGWRDVTPPGNHSFDYQLQDAGGPVRVQVKLQRSERGRPVVTSGRRFGLGVGMYLVEPQRTRSGTDKASKQKTRPYRYGEFDILAVSLQPATRRWDRFTYSVGDWLIPGKQQDEIATYQPVAMSPNGDWTDDFTTAAAWFRSGIKKRIASG